jgi:NADH:ubiquinone oxidoreductase subunit 5 (subunit L)/multisubunit Na+/H+ antiporter MnhA subunit
MFKALLFLGAGSIIHAVHSNEMSAMGGLRKYMPITHWTFLIACLAIAGIPPFSGFFSKDEILAACFQYSPAMGWVMTVIAAMTAFYTTASSGGPSRPGQAPIRIIAHRTETWKRHLVARMRVRWL